MQQNILTNFKRSISLTKAQEEHILSYFKPIRLKKREHLLQSNSICHDLAYVQKGNLRIYSVDDYVLESNIYFATDDWWAVDLKSFIEQAPARFSIQALTDCELLAIHKLNFEKLLEEIPVLEKWFRILLQNALIASENRIGNKISLTAEQRYLEFLKKYPNLETQIAQKHISSYLGITAEHLSKIKSRRIKSKRITPKP